MAHDHGHTHGLVERSIVRSRAGVRLVILEITWSSWRTVRHGVHER